MKRLGNVIIYESPEEIVDPEHTALVVWDSQNALVNSIFNRDEYLANLKALLDSSRQQQIPVVYTKITPVPSGYQSAWTLYQQMKRFNVDSPAKIPVFMKPGSSDAEINAMVAPNDGEVVLNKHTSNIFFGTSIEQWMRFRGIQTLLFTGISTEIGVEHSAREASIRGFYTVVVSDCVSSRDRSTHEMSMNIMSRLCLVMSSTAIMKTWTT